MTPHTSPLSPYVVTLGTTGGPRWWNGAGESGRHGISTAIVVGDDVYLVDCGEGAGRQLRKAGLSLEQVKGIFITHLHSDHIAGLSPILLFSLFERKNPLLPPITLIGPGSRGRLTPPSRRAVEAPRAVSPDQPTPGTAAMVRLLVKAFASDFNDRIFDSLTRSPLDHFNARDIEIPAACGFDPDHNVSPPMEPFRIYSDDSVTVTATLVSHAPMAPAFAFRFDTAGGSVTISGDTAPCTNLVRLAQGTDLLLHEAISLELIAAEYSDTALMNATLDHHRQSHTTPREAGEIAARAGARHLALHHLVPSAAAREVWLEAGDTFSGTLHIPDDLTVIPFGSVPPDTITSPLRPDHVLFTSVGE